MKPEKISKSNNYILEHCVEKLARINHSDFAMGFLIKNTPPPFFIDEATQVVIAPDTLFDPIKEELTQHLTDTFFNKESLCEPKFYDSKRSTSVEPFLENQYIDNLRYIPVGTSDITYAVVVLVNVDLSFNTKELIDVAPFLLATITLLKNQNHHIKQAPTKPKELPSQEHNQTLVESILKHTFHSTFLFNDEFKVLKANSASQRLFNSNIERGWPSMEKLINRTLPSIAFRLLTSISKYFFLGHLDKQKWQDVELILNNYQTVTVDIHLFDVNYYGRQCFGLMINEKTDKDFEKESYNASLQRFNALTSVVPMAILQVDKDFSCSYVNETWSQYTGLHYEQSVKNGWLQCLSSSNIEQSLADILRIISLSKSYKGEIQLRSVENKRLWVSINAVGLFNDKYELTGLIITMYDISDERLQSEKLHKMANYDHLTGLSNRAFFTDRLGVALSRVRRHGITALMFLDLDRFKIINDTLGHPVGDKVIQEVANRLKANVRDEDSIARLGGDEFAIIFTDVSNEQVLATIAEKIVSSISLPLTIDEQPMSLSCSIGIALADSKNIEPSDILRKADLALYEAKDTGRNRFCFYDDSLEKDNSILNSIRNNLNEPSDKGFSLVFQPLMDASTEGLIGFEVLSRWSNISLDNIGPNTFIKIIEENGLIHHFSDWLFHSVIVQVKLWLAEGLLKAPQKIAVNLSIKQLHLVEFADNLIKMFYNEGISPGWFTLEVTETAFVQDPAIAGNNLRKLKDAGFLIALDDFGTGYSSLGLLRKMPLDYIKIDRSFIKDILTDHEAEKVVSTIIGLGKMLDLVVIAEGVENIATKEWLVAKGCYCHQGYYFSKPIEENKVLRLLNNNKIVKQINTELEPNLNSDQ